MREMQTRSPTQRRRCRVWLSQLPRFFRLLQQTGLSESCMQCESDSIHFNLGVCDVPDSIPHSTAPPVLMTPRDEQIEAMLFDVIIPTELMGYFDDAVAHRVFEWDPSLHAVPAGEL